ncbi:MAG: TM0996/MTH895 family glutaredoxin-like protein [Gammaproteobacteria bacterium]|nr:TM0996/MTH895 family glutaredoxin-like protein [Gammaproteobacteria bacterium]
MKIQIAGPGCAKCQACEKNVREACAQLGVEAEIEHLTEPREFAPLGVMMTPAVLIDGRLLVSGHVPTVDKLKQAISEAG